MRSLIITIVAFFATVCLIALNFTHVNAVAEQMTSLTLTLDMSKTEECGAIIEEIEGLWQKNEAIFSLSVSFRETDHLGETILSLRSAFECRDLSEFEKQRALLVDAIDGVARLERFSVINIF